MPLALPPALVDALPLLHAAAVATGLLLYVALTHSGRQRRAPASAMAWVIALVAFPYLALPAYLLFGTRKLAHARTTIDPPPSTQDATVTWALALTRGLDLPPARRCGSIVLDDDGPRALQSLLALLDSAARSIDIEMFLFRDDAVGLQVADALARARARSVDVRVLLDGVGAFAGRRRSLRMLRRAGAAIRWFSPLKLRPQFARDNLRDHRKLIIVDARALWSGGRNLAREYFLDAPEAPAWHDLSVVVEGGIVVDAVAGFARDWAMAGGEPAPISPISPIARTDADGPLAQLLPSGPDRRDDTAYGLFLGAIHRADARALLATPYFVPDDALQLALVLAARRGVQVELLLPVDSNHALADIARERSLRELVAAGARIHLLPRMLHAKALVIDAGLASCGSINFDGRSLFLNYELNVLFHDSVQIEALAHWFTARRAESSTYVARAPGWWRDVGEGLVRSVGFQL
jgi:cardiolipin synthase